MRINARLPLLAAAGCGAAFLIVLGFAWQVQAVAAEQTDDDLARANSETTFLQETFAFFQGIKPGDFPAVEKRYRAREVR